MKSSALISPGPSFSISASTCGGGGIWRLDVVLDSVRSRRMTIVEDDCSCVQRLGVTREICLRLVFFN
eukprot:6852357-Pyramimonas_sp.AAC.1